MVRMWVFFAFGSCFTISPAQMRSVIETTPLDVEHFISLAGVQNGNVHAISRFLRGV
jgi:hypothetical protein